MSWQSFRVCTSAFVLGFQYVLCAISYLQSQVKKLIEQFPAAMPLALVLKQFLADRSLDQSYSGGLSSYCLVSNTANLQYLFYLINSVILMQSCRVSPFLVSNIKIDF